MKTFLKSGSSTFPSLYVTLRSAVTVKDRCGIKGSIYQSPIIAVPSGGLTTLSYPSRALGADLGMTKGPYNPEACPTYGVSDPRLSSFWYVEVNRSVWTTTTYRTIGAPYNPIIMPPQELINLDPEWKSCTEWYSQGVFAGFSYGLFDPPRALTPVASMSNPMATSAVLTTQTSPTITLKSSAQPANASTTIITRSKINSEPPKGSLTSASSSIASSYLDASTIEIQPSSILFSSSTISISSGFDPAASSANSPSDVTITFATTPTRPAVTALSNSDSGSSSPETSPLISVFTASSENTALDPSIDPDAVQSGEQTGMPTQSPSNHGLESHTQNPSIATEGRQQVTATLISQPTSAELGPAILSGLGITDPTTMSQQQISQPNLPSTTVLSSVPTILSIGESVISQGEIAVTISGTHLSLGSAGLVVSPETFSLELMNFSALSPEAQTFTTYLKSSIVTSASSTHSVGGAAETFAGISSSLEPSETLGSGPGLGGPRPLVITVAGQSFTANPFSVTGTTISAGGHGVIISDTTVSLASSGKLIIDSSVASSGRYISTTAGQPFTTSATISSFIGATVSASGSDTTISELSISSSRSEGSVGGGTAALFVSSSSAPIASSVPTGSDGVTLSSTAVVLKPSETLLIDSSGTLTLPSSDKSPATSVLKAGQSRVVVPRLALFLALTGSALFCSRRWTIS